MSFRPTLACTTPIVQLEEVEVNTGKEEDEIVLMLCDTPSCSWDSQNHIIKLPALVAVMETIVEDLSVIFKELPVAPEKNVSTTNTASTSIITNKSNIDIMSAASAPSSNNNKEHGKIRKPMVVFVEEVSTANLKPIVQLKEVEVNTGEEEEVIVLMLCDMPHCSG